MKDYKKMWETLRTRVKWAQEIWLKSEEMYQKNGKTITPYYHYTRIIEMMDELEAGNERL